MVKCVKGPVIALTRINILSKCIVKNENKLHFSINQILPFYQVETLVRDMDNIYIKSIQAVQKVMINDKHCFELYPYNYFHLVNVIILVIIVIRPTVWVYLTVIFVLSVCSSINILPA